MSRGTRDLRRLVSDVRAVTPPTATPAGLNDLQPGEGDDMESLQRKLTRLQALSQQDKELIVSLQALVDERDTEMDSLQRNYETLSESFENLKESSASKEIELENVRRRLAAYEDDARDTAQTAQAVEDLKARIDELLGEQMRREQDLIRERQMRQEAEEDAKGYEKRVAELTASHSEVNLEYDRVVKEAGAMKLRLARVETELEDATSRLADLSKANTSSTTTMQEMQGRLREAEQGFSRASLECERTQSEALRLMDRVAALEEETSSQADALAASRNKVLELEAALDDSKRDVARLEGEARGLLATRAKVGEKAEGLQARLQQAEAAEKRAQYRETEKARELAAVQSEVVSLRKAVEESVAEVKELREGAVRDAEAHAQKLQAAVAAEAAKQSSALEAKEREIRTLQELTASLQEASSGSDRTASQLSEQVQGLSRLLKEEREGRATERAEFEAALAEAEEQALLGKRTLEAVAEREKAISAAARRMLLAEEAAEPALTCMACVEVFTSPATHAPCGHTFCGTCANDAGQPCQECGKTVEWSVKSAALESVASKFALHKQALEGIVEGLAAGKGRQAFLRDGL